MEKIQVTPGADSPIQIEKGTTLLALSKRFAHRLKNPILLAKEDNRLRELHDTLTKDCTVSFLDISDENGFRLYQRSVTFLMVCAVKRLFGDAAPITVKHSLHKNYYCELPGQTVTDELLHSIEMEMRSVAAQNHRIFKISLPVDTCVEIAERFGLLDKIDVFRYRRASRINFYKLCDVYDYFYGPMAYDTSVLTTFRLTRSGGGFFLQFASSEDMSRLIPIKPSEKITQVFLESSEWARILRVHTVGALNNTICAGLTKDIVLISEALHEKKIAQIADTITAARKSVVLIAGPSSSGKTTFAERLCIQLRVNGVKPYIISIDDYYLNRDDLPLGADGQKDFECLEALDLARFNQDINDLLRGEAVQMPSFNFMTGKREYKGRVIKLRKDEVLVLEGIHGLNEKLTERVPKTRKFKIFISALTQLNLDAHNRIATTDTRLIRRIVRDHQFRGFDAQANIALWPKVARGEQQYIFPFQEEADVLFNSALVYELSALKQYAEPLLFQIANDMPEYTQARRLIKFLDSFLGIGSEDIPPNSIIREFIGRSCFQTFSV